MLINDNYLFIKDIDKYKKLIVGKCPTSDFNKLKMELKEKFDNGDLIYLAGTLNSLKDFDDYWMDNDIQETVKAVKNKFINNNLIKNL